MENTSFRYGGGARDIRSALIQLSGRLQRKKTVLLNSDPQACGRVLAASDVKGTFIEYLFATGAWHPVYSVESVDGELWEQLSKDCKKVMGRIEWRERLSPLIDQQLQNLPQMVIDAETISRLVLRAMFELLFETPILTSDEDLFFQASLEFRKEIGVKRGGDPKIKEAFWKRLKEVIAESPFKEGLQTYSDPGRWVSVFAQPFLISPQINISDIMTAAFHFLRQEPGRLDQARGWALAGDSARLNGILMEAIRLQHPFPILERELQSNLKVGDQEMTAGTQVLILFDQFKQDQTFKPERWLESSAENPYHSMPFGAGRRMCIGKPIALIVLNDLLKGLLTRFEDSQLQPQEGHLYSGRNNDGKESLLESLYQLKKFSKALWVSYQIGRRRAKPPETCPWTALPPNKSSPH